VVISRQMKGFLHYIRELSRATVALAIFLLGLASTAVTFVSGLGFSAPRPGLIRGIGITAMVAAFVGANYRLYAAQRRQIDQFVTVVPKFEKGWFSVIGPTDDYKFIKLHVRLWLDVSNKSTRNVTFVAGGLKSIGGVESPTVTRLHLAPVSSGIQGGPSKVVNVGAGLTIPTVLEIDCQVPNRNDTVAASWKGNVEGSLAYHHTFEEEDSYLSFTVPLAG